MAGKRRKDRDDEYYYKGGRIRLPYIVTVIVTAVVILCALISWEDKHGGGMFPSISAPIEAVNDFLDEFTIKDSEPVHVNSALPDALLEIHIQDMGQADSILIKGPDATLLIDAGENNQGRDVLRYLESHGVKKLDYVIGTHPHSDHIGGLDTVIKGIAVGKIILPEVPEDIHPATQTYLDVLTAIEEKGVELIPAKPGRTLDLGDGAELRIIAPIGVYTDLNNMSVVSRLTYGDTSFLFTGDASAGSEGDILDSGQRIKSDVLDIGHHGSNTSTTEEFLAAVSPRIATISCGLDNSYGHPHRDVMERLQKRGIQIYRTDLGGAIVIVSNGERLSVSSEKQGA